MLRITCVTRGGEKTSSREQTLFGVNKYGFVYFSLSKNKAFQKAGSLCQTSYLQGRKNRPHVLEILRRFTSAQCTTAGSSFLFLGSEVFPCQSFYPIVLDDAHPHLRR